MTILCDIATIYLYVIVARVIVSWFPMPSPNSVFASAMNILDRATEPVLAPVRRLIPPIGGMGLDLSPLIVLLVIQFVILPLLCS